jgi:hypothetical protein
VNQAPGPRASEDETITIVSGLPRSGTSLMMRALEAAGKPLLIDGLRRPDEDNPRGYYEFERVKQIADDRSWLEQAHGKAVKLIAQLLFHLPRGPRYKVVFMRRALHEVLASQKVMLQRRSQAESVPDDEEMRRVLIRHLLDVEDRLRQRPDLETLFVSFNRMLGDPLRQADRISRFLGGGLSASAMAETVDPALYRQRGEATRAQEAR